MRAGSQCAISVCYGVTTGCGASVPQKAVVELLQPQRVPLSKQTLRRPLRLVQIRQGARRLQTGVSLARIPELRVSGAARRQQQQRT